VHRQEILFTKHILHRFLEAVEALGACIGIICLHHRCQLVVTHGIGTAIGKHIQKNIFRAQPEGVESAFLQRLQPSFDWYKV